MHASDMVRVLRKRHGPAGECCQSGEGAAADLQARRHPSTVSSTPWRVCRSVARTHGQLPLVRQLTDRDRVICVVTTGQAWQFKPYKWMDPKILFRHGGLNSVGSH